MAAEPKSSPSKSKMSGGKSSNNSSSPSSASTKKIIDDKSPPTSTSNLSPPSSPVIAFVIYCVLPLAFFALAGFYGELTDRSPPSPSVSSSRSRGGRNDDEAPGGSVLIDTSKMPQTDDISEILARRGIKVNAGLGTGGGGGSKDDQKKEESSRPLSVKERVDQYIDGLRKEHAADPTNIYKALNLAESLRQRDLTYHDGGTAQVEAIETYEAAIDLILAQRQELVELGKPTNVPLSGKSTSMNEELLMETTAKSTDGLLCATYCSLAKILFMANMFERAVTSYDKALELAPDYLDALTYRASTLIILGRYGEAARDYQRVLELDTKRLFVDVYTGMGKVLVAREESVEGGWTSLVDTIEKEIPLKEAQLATLPASSDDPQVSSMKGMIVDALKRMHLTMFSYHDTKTGDANKAWEHLSAAYRHKMSILPPWNSQHEESRVAMVKQVFQRGFWPEHVGSDSRVPIFVIGFVRSGSTLLERVLDAHPDIVGTGEDSVFNGQLELIRNKIVEASMSQDPLIIQRTVQALADGVVKDMRERWQNIESNLSKDGDEDESGKEPKEDPKRFVDKMLTNYMNVGFIHMLFPNALVLHVVREPMDCVFSAFKHDFPPGTLDYTSDFPSLAQLYLGYREIMEHWDTVLPGRVTHIRYEDLVEDLPGVAKALIETTGLPWDDNVLEFHKKKHAVNTLSTTQVRKGIYKDHLKSWLRYEERLRPLVELLGDRVQHDFKTTVPGYEK